MQEVERKGRSEYYRLRTLWSWYIFGTLVFMVLFEYILLGFLIWGIVTDRFTFDNSKQFLYILSGQNFAQILGLSYIVVKFLVPDPLKSKGEKKE